MTIEKNKVVTFHYRLSESGTAVLEDSRQSSPAVYLHGHNKMMPGLEKALAGKLQGDSLSVTLAPEEAYGLRHDIKPQRVPIKHVLNKGKLKAGMAIQINTSDGARDATIVKVGRFNVDVDPNHPLAGKTLAFEIEILDVRDANEQEISNGHIQSDG